MSFPKRFLPFAVDAGSNPFCIDMDSGEIVIIWLDKGVVTDDEIIWLANDFDEFLDFLDKEDNDE